MTTTFTTISHSLLSFLSNPVLQQLAPLIIVLAFPLVVLSGRNYLRAIPSFVFSMLAVASSALPWNWLTTYEHGSSTSKKPRKNHPIRTHAEQLAARTNGHTEVGRESLFYPGLVNISGTYCFMNSIMQALASLYYLQPHIDAIHAKAEVVDIATPVIDALHNLLHGLNTPSSRYRSIRPVDMIEALSQPEPGKRIPLFSSREHQDAQELFQLVSEYIKKEATAVDREGARDLGFGALALISSTTAATSTNVSKGVFDGLTANRRSCCECGYTEAVMHFPFDNWQLAVPRLANCRLEDCLMDYTRLEVLTDCICRKCSMRATLVRLEQDAERLTAEVGKPTVSQSKKKRVREVRRLAGRLKSALDEGRIEEDIKGVKIEKVISRASTKQAMVARPPPVLALHLNRSVHFGAYASKNMARVHFPEVLDLTPFTTSGMLSTSPSIPISSHPPTPIPTYMPPPPSIAAVAAPSTKTRPATQQAPPRVLYRLAAVVCHYGQHSFGHYVCFRRKPRGEGRVVPPWLDELAASSGKGWLRASDDAVREVGIETVLRENAGAFMLYYERVFKNEGGGGGGGASIRSSVGVGPDVRAEAGKMDGGSGSGDEGDDEERVQRYHIQDSVKQDLRERDGKGDGEEEGEEGDLAREVASVIKARVVQNVSLAGDDEEEVGGGGSVKQEVETESPTLSVSPKSEVEHAPAATVESTLVSAEAPPIPSNVLAVDEPPISLRRTVDLRA